jgi:hypothetical protein
MRVFVYTSLLTQTLVRGVMVLHLDTIMFFEERMHNTCGGSAVVRRSTRRRCVRRGKGGFATVGEVALEDDL